MVIHQCSYINISEYFQRIHLFFHKQMWNFQTSSLPPLSLCIEFIHIFYWINIKYSILTHINTLFLKIFHLKCNLRILAYRICIIKLWFKHRRFSKCWKCTWQCIYGIQLRCIISSCKKCLCIFHKLHFSK